MSPRPPKAPPASPVRGSAPSRREPVRERARDAAPAAPKQRAAGDAADVVMGVGAARAVLTLRPGDVLDLVCAREARAELAELVREAERHRLPCREVPRDELTRMVDSVHHEGVSLRVRRRPPTQLADLLRRLPARCYLLALDGVDNPHNQGALLRSAAYFGAAGMLVEGRDARLGSAAVRVAEGGAESVPLCGVPSLESALATLRASSFEIIGADAHEGAALQGFRFPARSVLVLGSERHGLSAAVQARLTGRVRIVGTSAVESLNVSVAAGILMANAFASISREP
jgi:RNA methyltransferase, TrmH family